MLAKSYVITQATRGSKISQEREVHHKACFKHSNKEEIMIPGKNQKQSTSYM